MLRLENIHKSFGSNEVLKGVSLEVPTGSVTVIIGPSGSGKTTLLRGINFLEPSDQGKIILDDLQVDVAKATKKEIHQLRKETAMVFQSYNLFANKTALENITEGLLIVKDIQRRKPWKKQNIIYPELACWIRQIPIPASYQGGSSSGSGLPGLLHWIRKSSCLMSLLRHWIPNWWEKFWRL